MVDRSQEVPDSGTRVRATRPSTPAPSTRTPAVPFRDRMADVLADADLRRRNPAHAQMIASTSVEQAEAVQARRGW